MKDEEDTAGTLTPPPSWFILPPSSFILPPCAQNCSQFVLVAKDRAADAHEGAIAALEIDECPAVAVRPALADDLGVRTSPDEAGWRRVDDLYRAEICRPTSIGRSVVRWR
jgi:hypothetical protein